MQQDGSAGVVEKLVANQGVKICCVGRPTRRGGEESSRLVDTRS